MDNIAPMLRRLGYDPHANPPNYGEADLKIKENTYHIQVILIIVSFNVYLSFSNSFNFKTNKEYWKELAKKYSVHVKDGPL